MGGTSTDIALLDGALSATSEAEVAGLPVRVPMLNIHNGGRRRRINRPNRLRAARCAWDLSRRELIQGRSATDEERSPPSPTRTLSSVALRADNFLGGEFRLDLERTRFNFQRMEQEAASRVVCRRAREWDYSREVNATMEKGIRLVSIEQGHDPRAFSLLAFGGAGRCTRASWRRLFPYRE